VEAGARGYIAVAVEGRRARVHMWDEVGGGGGGGCGCGAVRLRCSTECARTMWVGDLGFGVGAWDARGVRQAGS
jgi:hypothetical protein